MSTLDRRQFLKVGTAASIAAAALPVTGLAQAADDKPVPAAAATPAQPRG